jgi:phosphoribosylamine--glycine ligase
LAAANENQDEINLEIDERSATTIMVSFWGYPNFEKESILGLETIEDSIVFTRTKLDNGRIVSNGGRVLTVTSWKWFEEEKILPKHR